MLLLKNINRTRIYLIGCFFMLMAALFLLFFSDKSFYCLEKNYLPIESPSDYQNVEITNTKNIEEGIQINQPYEMKCLGLYLVGLDGMVEDESLIITITDNTSNIVIEKEIPMTQLKCNDFTYVEINKKFEENIEYLLNLKLAGTDEKAKAYLIVVPEEQSASINTSCYSNGEKIEDVTLYSEYQGEHILKPSIRGASSWILLIGIIVLMIIGYIKRKSIVEMPTYVAIFMISALGIIVSYNIYISFHLLNKYHYSQYILSYRFGWIPRGLIGQIGSILFGDAVWYTGKGMDLFIAFLFTLFLIWIFKNMFEGIMKCKNYAYIFMFGIIVITPILRSVIANMSHCEGPVWILCAIIFEVARKEKPEKVVAISAIFCIIAVLVSESNLFFICPALVSIALIYTVAYYDLYEIIHHKYYLLLEYIPVVGLAIYISRWHMSNEMLNKWLSFQQILDQEMFSKLHIMYFLQRENEINNLYGINAAVEAYSKYGMSIFVIPFGIILIAGIQLFFSKAELKIQISYYVLTIASYIFILSFRIIASDEYRSFPYAIFAVFLISIFAIFRYGNKKIPIYVAFFYAIISIFISWKYSTLFITPDEWHYRTIQDFMLMLQ